MLAPVTVNLLLFREYLIAHTQGRYRELCADEREIHPPHRLFAPTVFNSAE
jgi:hypothetical protein